MFEGAAYGKRSCRLCGGEILTPGEVEGLVECGSCRFVVSERIWEDASNAQLEQEWFEIEPLENNSSWIRLFRRSINRRTFCDIREQVSLRPRLLEIGVGDGSLLVYLKRRGFQVEGCDLSKAVCKHVERLHGVSMYNCSVGNRNLTGPYKVIVMNHVLEHVNDPVGFLANARDLLSPGGIVRIAVPNVGCWEAKLPGWGGYEPYHLAYFAPRTLQQVLERAGFTVVNISTHDSFSGWFLALLRTALGTNRQGAEVRRQARTARRNAPLIRSIYYTAMITAGAITMPLRWAQTCLGHGDEIVAIARTRT